MSVKRALAVIAAAAVLAGLVVSPLQAPAARSPVRVVHVDYTQGRVALAALCETGAVRATLSADEHVLDTVERPATGSTEVTFTPVRLTKRMTLKVTGYGGSGAVLWTESIALDPASYRPRKPQLKVASGKVVSSPWTFKGDASRTVTKARTYVRSSARSSRFTIASGNKGAFTIRGQRLPFGRSTVVVRAGNGFGWSSAPATVRVYNLGSSLPKASRYILVAKSSFWMFDVSKGRVIRSWPIAIGMAGTPTPTGTFRIGSAQASSGPWGPLRRPLRRVTSYGLRYTGYYIHGHAPGACWSIGMAASHGCVRMHNVSIREFTRVVPTGTLVRIK